MVRDGGRGPGHASSGSPHRHTQQYVGARFPRVLTTVFLRCVPRGVLRGEPEQTSGQPLAAVLRGSLQVSLARLISHQSSIINHQSSACSMFHQSSSIHHPSCSSTLHQFVITSSCIHVHHQFINTSHVINNSSWPIGHHPNPMHPSIRYPPAPPRTPRPSHIHHHISNNNNNNRRLVTLAEHTSDHGRQTNSSTEEKGEQV